MQEDLTNLLSRLSDQEYCYLTTTGRVSGRPHEIEIWFGTRGRSIYLLSGGGRSSDWVRNLLKTPEVTVRIAKHVFSGTARLVTDQEEETAARYMLAEKYQEWEEGRTLSEWARTALPVAVDLQSPAEISDRNDNPAELLYSTILFDWGDTVMRDYPERITPMVEWETVEVIEGIGDVLAYVHSTGRRIALATSAAISDEDQIRGALRRGGLDTYFSRIYCFKNTNLPKGEEFYRYILNDLNLYASDALMVGDGFEKDIQIPNVLGIFGVWFNPKSGETRENEQHVTVHSMQELRTFFESLDQKSMQEI